MQRCTAIMLSLLALGAMPFAACADYFTDISHGFALGEVQELMVGEQVAPIIEVESQTPLSQGVAIILVEPFLSNFSLAQSKELADYLSQKGWHVVISPFNMSMMPLSEETASETTDAPSSATDPSDAASSTSNKEGNPGSNNVSIHPRSTNLTQYFDFDDTTQQLSTQLLALNNKLQNVQGYRLVIAQGMIAAAFLDATSKNSDFEPDSFISVSPYWPQHTVNRGISELIASSTFPVLDLSIEGLSDWESNTVVMRRNRAKTSLKLHYRQIILPSSNSVFSLNQNQKTPYIQLVANNTIGWTRYLGW